MRRATSSEPIAVVVGLQHLTALGTVRSLAREGVPVAAITSNPRSPLAKTRVCRKLRCEDVNGAPLIDTLLELGKTLQEKAVLFPCSDLQVALISEHRDVLLPFYHVGLPSKEMVRVLLDKGRFAAFAEQNGFVTPRTLVIDRSTPLAENLGNLRLPCILKPWVRTADWKRRYRGKKVLRFADLESLSSEVNRGLELVERLVVQEWIEGADSDVYFCLMYFDGSSRPLAAFVGRKIRQWLPEIGSTASAEKCDSEEVLNESIRLFTHVRFVGMGSVEFKLDRRRKSFQITEPTVGRPNLQSCLAVANGVNIPHIAYRDLIGDTTRCAERPANGAAVKWIHERSEYLSARHYLRRGDLTLAQWYRSLRGPKQFALFSLSDPLPFLATVGQEVASSIRGVGKRTGHPGSRTRLASAEAIGGADQTPE